MAIKDSCYNVVGSGPFADMARSLIMHVMGSRGEVMPSETAELGNARVPIY